MTNHILQCGLCKEFTVEGIHCDQKTIPPQPPKFQLEDKYVDLKRKALEPQRAEQGVL